MTEFGLRLGRELPRRSEAGNSAGLGDLRVRAGRSPLLSERTLKWTSRLDAPFSTR